jgi:hypothetical protein
VFPQNSPPTQFTSKQDSWHQTTNSSKQHQQKKTYQEVQHIRKKKKTSASDVSERLSEAQHHAAQGKAFALSKV